MRVAAPARAALALALALAAALAAPAPAAATPPNAILLGGSEVGENLPAGTPVGTLTALDADPGDTHTFLLVDNPGAAFRVGADGATLETARLLDFEARASYGLRVRATDASGAFYEQYFTVSVLNANDPPLGVTLSAAGVAEDRPLHSAVGSLSPLGDQDQGDAFTYTLVDSADGAFALEGSALVTAIPLDHEATASYDLLVRVTDRAGASAEDWLTVAVFDRNEAPRGVSLAAAPLPETAAPGTTVGLLSATGDPDRVDAHAFALVDAGQAPFAVVGGALVTTGPLDHEAAPTWTLTVRVTDLGLLSATATVLVVVADANEAPTGATLVPGAVHETVSIGSLVGALAGVDPDAGDAHTFTLLGPPAAPFTLAGPYLQTTAPLDFEADPVHFLAVRVTDRAGASVDTLVTVALVDDNEAPTALALSSAAVFEDAGASSAVGTLSAVDPDRSDLHTFALVDDPSARFSLVGDTLRVARALDFEAAAAHTLRVRATDRGGLSVERDLVITVRDVNEAPSGVVLSASVVAEGLPAGTLAATLAAADDPDQGDTHTFTLVQNPGGAFRVVGERLETTAPLDFEQTDRYALRLRVTDAGGLAAETYLELQVHNVNEPPTGLTLSSAVVPEARPADQWVGQLDVQGDPDRQEAWVLTLIDNPDDAFVIAGNALKTAKVLDFEERATYPLRVRATDKGGLFVEVALAVRVLDQNEAPLSVALTATGLPENLPIGSEVARLSAVGDPDAGDRHAFALWDSAGGRFAVDGDRLVTAMPFDYEADPETYRLQLEVRDRGGLSAQRTVTLLLLDVNEPPRDLDLDPRVLDEAQPAGTLVGRLRATGDPDTADTFTFAWGEGRDDAFTLDGDAVRTRRPLDFEAAPEHHLPLVVTDAAGHAVARTFTVTVRDVPEPPLALALTPDRVAENLRVGTVVGQLAALGDPDRGDAHTFALRDGSDPCLALDPEGRVLTACPLDFEAAAEHRLAVRATDLAGLTFDADLVVRVDDVNDAPVLGAPELALSPVDEDDADPAGDAVAELALALAITDDDPTPVAGLHLVPEGEDRGRWEFRGADGGPWRPFGGLARTLSALGAARVRFVPAADFAGELSPALVVRAWDGSAGEDGGAADLAAMALDPTAFSAEEARATLTVVAYNDAPVVTVPGVVVAASERTPVGLAAAGPITVGDVDADTLDLELAAPDGGLELPADAQVTILGGTQGSALLALTGRVEALNAALAGLRFVGAPGFRGEAEVTLTALDRGRSGLGGPKSGRAVVRVAVAAGPDLELARGPRVLQGGGLDGLGEVGAGGALELAYRLTNRGSAEVRLSDAPPVAVVAALNAVALVTVEPPARLVGGEGAELVVTLTPVVPGPFEARLSFASDDPDESPFAWTVSGRAVASARLGFARAGVALPDEVPLDLGARPAGEAAAVPLAVVNTGASTLTLGATQIARLRNAEVDVEEPFPVLNPGASELLRLHVEPFEEGAFEARVEVASDDPAGPRVLELRGRGVAPGAHALEVERVAGSALAPGGVDDVGEVAAVGVTGFRYALRNAGLRSVALGEVTVIEASGAAAVGRVSGRVVRVGEEAGLYVELTPEAEGPFEVRLALGADAATGGVFTWAMVGEAVAEGRARLRFWRDGEGPRGDEDDLGALEVGAERRLVYQLENAGAVAAMLVPPVSARALDNARVRVRRQPASVLGPSGDASPVVVSFEPLGPGPSAFELVARVREGDAVRETVLRVGSDGQAPRLGLAHEGRALADGDGVTLPLRAPREGFSVTLVASNEGTAPLAFTAPARLVGGEACLSASPLPASLPPGAETGVVVGLVATPGPFACRLELYTDAPERGGVFAVTLRGYGRAPGTGGGCGAGTDPSVGMGLSLCALALWVWRSRRRRAR